MSQAIRTFYLPTTATKPTRIKAVCERGSITVTASNVEHNRRADIHREVVKLLLAKFDAEDIAKHGPKAAIWGKTEFVSGQLADGSEVHVLVS